MTNHLRAIDIKEYAKALDVAKEFADRAEKADAAIARVREVCEQQAFPLNDVPTMAVTVTQILHALDGDTWV